MSPYSGGLASGTVIYTMSLKTSAEAKASAMSFKTFVQPLSFVLSPLSKSCFPEIVFPNKVLSQTVFRVHGLRKSSETYLVFSIFAS